jgi:glycosyltransferase involved in cell wall biosynthesis
MAAGSPMKLVISAVNFTEGGPLTVLREIVRAAARHYPQWTVYVLVHALGTVDEAGVIEMAFPESKRSWLRRLQLEWFTFLRLSRKLSPDVWISLHDITPRVVARRQYVYCHNPAPFCDQPISGERFDRTFGLFRRFYAELYRCFIHRNRAVIVQQEWLRQEFRRRFGTRRVIVAYPEVSMTKRSLRPRSAPSRFLYPAFPRVFKNFEVLGESIVLLENDPRWTGTIVVTIDGSENAYAADIRARFGHCRSLCFAGLQSPEHIAALYESCDAVVFPSLLETWGLPLTEAKAHGLPILAADLPYARETVGGYAAATFFDARDAASLAETLLRLHLGEETFGHAQTTDPAPPFVRGWQALLEVLLVDDQNEEGATR